MLALYPWIGAAYQWALRGVAERALSSGPISTVIEPNSAGGWNYIDVNSRGQRLEILHLDRDGLRLQTLNIVLLPSLLLATPVNWRRRLLLLASGVALLFAVQVAVAIAWAPTARCLLLRPDDRLCGWLYYLMITGGQLVAVAIWGLLTWRVWLHGHRPMPTR
jgi:hypothetical protein